MKVGGEKVGGDPGVREMKMGRTEI